MTINKILISSLLSASLINFNTTAGQPINIQKTVKESVDEVYQEFKGQITLDLPSGYTLSEINQSKFKQIFQYRLIDNNCPKNPYSWSVSLIPLQAVQELDEKCLPWVCMHDDIFSPVQSDFLAEEQYLLEHGSENIKEFNGQKYYVFNTLINGDDSLKRVYITYFGGIRVVFTTEMKYKTEAGLKDAFMHNTKIINLQ